MAKDLDKNGRRFETGQPVTVDGKTGFLVIGGHEDGVSLIDADGHRTVISVPDGKSACETVVITGDAPDAAGLAKLHEKWAAQAESNRLAAAKA
jgi:hypothetical protein